MPAAKTLVSSQAISLMGRVGYVSRGIVYLLVGVSAAIAAIEPGHRPSGPTDALQLGHGHPLGAVFLLLIALGLACLGAWFTVAGVASARYSGARSYWRAIGMLGDAIVYIAFMIDVAGVAFGIWHGPSDRNLQSWTAWLSAHEYGRVLVGIAGTAVAAGGVGLIVWALIGDVEGPLALPQNKRRLLRPIARYGVAGRGLAIFLVGAYLIAAAVYGNPREAHEVGGVLAAMRGAPFGQALIGLFALAFIGSSLFDFVAGLYRRFDPENP